MIAQDIARPVVFLKELWWIGCSKCWQVLPDWYSLTRRQSGLKNSKNGLGDFHEKFQDS